MHRPLSVIALTLAFVLMGCGHLVRVEPAPFGAPQPWPHDVSDLKPDPAVVWGRLENGLRYAILPHAKPHERVSVCLHVQVGAFHEAEHEEGYAHFVEHLAFRDTRDFPRQGAIAALQRLGAGFGADVNATTGWFETDYRFDDLPTAEPDALATGLRILRAMADGIVFTRDGVAREREVILHEDRQRDGTTGHAWRDQTNYLPPRSVEVRGIEMAALFRGTRLAERSPIGTEATLRAATAKSLRAFYTRWYRPERMILAVTGDLSPAATEALIRQTFSSLIGRGPIPAEPAVEDAKNENGPARVHQSRDAEPVMRLTFGRALARTRVDTADGRLRSLARRTALGMLAERLERLAENPDAPFLSVSAVELYDVPGRELTVMRADARPTLWPQALATLDREVRRAVEFGFAAAEFQRAVRRETLRVAYQARLAARDSAAVLARSLAFAVARGVVFTSTADDREREERGLAALTMEECAATIRELLPADQLNVALSGPFIPGTADPSEIDGVVRTSRLTSVTPYVPPPAPPPFPYTDFGPPGVVVKREHDAALDAELIQFANGVRLNLKRTAFEPGGFQLNVRFGGGALACPPDQAGLHQRMFTWLFGGLRDLTPEEQHAMLADLNESSAGITATIAPTSFRLAGSFDSSVLPLSLQSAAAHFRWPAYREEAWTRAFEFSRQAFASYESVAADVTQAGLRWRMSNGHPSQREPRIAEAAARTLEEFKTWFASQLADPIEIALIGDIDLEEALDAVARTFGALPPRPADDPYVGRRRGASRERPFSETISFRGMPGVAVVALAWPATGITSFAERLRGDVLTSILEDRLRLTLRAEMGETYSPSATLVYDDSLTPPLAFVQCLIETAPDRTERVAAAARKVIEKLIRDGATADEFERARRPLVRQTESGLRDNDWWLDVISVAQTNPAYAGGWSGALTAYRTATVAEINTLLRRWLLPAQRNQLIVLPLAKAQTEHQTAGDFLDSAAEKLKRKDNAGAFADYDRALALNPNYASVFIRRASARFGLGDYDAAIADGTRAIELEPSNPQGYHNRAVARGAKGDLDGEMADYDRALALNPDLVDAIAYRGAGWLIKGDLKAALRDLDRALVLAPRHVYALRQRAEIKRKLGDAAGGRADDTLAEKLAREAK